MADTKASHGHGVTLTGTTAGAIANITRVLSIDEVSCEDIDITNHASVEKWREFISGLKDAGTISFEVQFLSGVISTINTNLGVADTWTVTFPNSDGSTFACSGYIKSYSINDDMEKEITGNVKIKLSGKPTFTV